jgi:hypothetical protein
MTIGGVFIMVVSVSLVCALFSWCVFKVLTASEDPSPKMHGFEQETPDTKPEGENG